MKTRSLMFMTVSLLIVVAIASGCGSKITVSTNPQTTTTSPQTTTTTTSSTQGGTLPDIGIAITTHSKSVMTAYKGLCLMCHGQNTSNAQPYPPTWDGKAAGSLTHLGVYTVAPGSKADHTGYTNDTDCTQANCHAAPTA